LKIELIAVLGRIADRTPMTIPGAARTAQALECRCRAPLVSVGTLAPTTEDDWTISLPQAEQTLRDVSKAIAERIARSSLTVMASNTCSASLASLPVVVRYYPGAKLLWFDAHGDFNTPDTTSSGYLGGMVLAGVCGLWDSGHGSGWRGDQIILVGTRDIDPDESDLLRRAGVRILDPDVSTPETVLAAVGDSKVWIHVDWDVLEPGYIPADYKVKGGLLPDQLRAILAALPKNNVIGLELAEYQLQANETEASVAVEHIIHIVEPLLGECS
jgi:arginase family enzyme